MMPIKPGSTRTKDGIIPNIERNPYKIFHHGRVVSFALEYHQFSQSIFKLKTAEKVRIKGIPKSDKDGIKGAKIAVPMNMPAAIGA